MELHTSFFPKTRMDGRRLLWLVNLAASLTQAGYDDEKDAARTADLQ